VTDGRYHPKIERFGGLLHLIFERASGTAINAPTGRASQE
jgi:hypothetical protein